MLLGFWYHFSMRYIFILLSLFFFLHILRNYLRITGVNNWFTQVGHVWNSPQLEIPGIIFNLLLGVLFLYLALRAKRQIKAN